MGSGELTATMVEVHKALLDQLPGSPQAAFLDTPAGFQLNVDQISRKAMEYFQIRVRHPLSTASYKSRETTTGLEARQAFQILRNSDYILIGPGSPTYAVRQWLGSPIPDILSQCIAKGGCLVTASAASLTVGRFTLPVYEIYKVGQDLHWIEGLNILGQFGLDLVAIPHWNNAEGGTHDTRFCFMGETRFRKLEALLPPSVHVLGLDEHTACILDFESGQAHIRGLGRVTLRTPNGELSFSSGDRPALDLLSGTMSTVKRSVSPEVAASRENLGPGRDAFWNVIHELEDNFQKGLEEHHPQATTNALLELDRVIWQAQRDLESEEFISQGRETFRDLIVLMGTALASSAGNRTECLAPLVEALLELRQTFRVNQHWVEADAIRDTLRSANITVQDAEHGSQWRLER